MTRIGVILPQNEMPPTAEALRAFAVGAEELGATHLLTYDHVLGADPAYHPEGPGLRPTGPPGRSGWAYTHEDPFHEPLVAFGYLAALTGLELVTGILILPQRQTALVAKQVAEVDVLSGGRVRLGVGIGWNKVEYDALGADFESRGRRMEEQVELLRRLWTEPVVSFMGEDHSVVGAGLVPLPVQRPIPMWMGTRAHGPALRRAGRIADGWLTMEPPGPVFERAWAELRRSAEEVGRDPAEVGLEGRIAVGDGDVDRMAREYAAWREIGATHLTLTSIGSGMRSPEEHLDELAVAMRAVAGSEP